MTRPATGPPIAYYCIRRTGTFFRSRSPAGGLRLADLVGPGKAGATCRDAGRTGAAGVSWRIDRGDVNATSGWDNQRIDRLHPVCDGA